MSKEQEELILKRTDTVLSILLLKDVDIPSYTEAMQGGMPTPEDEALASTLAVAESTPAYSMRDLNSPVSATSMVIPENLKNYLSGHAKVTTDYTQDWPQAKEDNPFGEHHPFGMKSNSHPLLHGAAHGDPEYVHHIMRSIEQLPIMAENEKAKAKVPTSEMSVVNYLGLPIESQHDLYTRDRNRNSFLSDEEYHDNKRQELSTSFGMLPQLFGLEWITEGQRSNFMDLMGQMAMTEEGSPDAKRIENQFQEKAGISWGRALRNWRERFKPMSSWWQRSPDRHGPTEPHPGGDLQHYMSPWVSSGSGIEPSMNYHHWEPYQYWGGVGRSIDSLDSILSQSYPDIFNGGWMNKHLINHDLEEAGSFNQGGTHFPSAVNQMEPDHPGRAALGSTFDPDNDYQKRLAMYSAASNRLHEHPSELSGGRIDVPDDALMMSSLGRALAAQTDMGGPRTGYGREEHPFSTDDYWSHHNEHFRASNSHMSRVMQQHAQKVIAQFGPQVLNPMGSDDEMMHTICRGNLQQIAAAANHSLLRMQMGESYKTLAPNAEMSSTMGSVGPVSPDSHAIVPPTYVSGDTDAWGHDMPATLTWRYDPEQQGYAYNIADAPFNILQRTAHADLVRAISPALMGPMSKLSPKTKDINAISSVDQSGYAPLQTGSLRKADDYEPTGVFETMIKPAHTVYDLDDLSTIKGFSGEWVVQKMPEGKRMLVKKEGKRVDPIDLPSKVKKALKERKGDFTVDAYVKGDKLNVVDLLVHKGTDLHMEPLEDRLNALRTLYHSDEYLHFPMPNSCITTDEHGLAKAVDELGGTGLLIRDATSTFIKGKEMHPKWVHFADEEIAKTVPYGPLPEVMVKGQDIILEYPGLLEPVIVKGQFNGRHAMDIDLYRGTTTLVKHARTQLKLWGPVAIALLKEGAAGGGGAGAGAGAGGAGTVSSTTGGTHSAIHSAPSKRKKPRKRVNTEDDLILRAPELLDDSGDREEKSHMMVHARRALSDAEEAMTSDELCTAVKGLTPKMIEVFGPEYGVERTEEGDKWTVNEAIDDDIIENFVYPRMNGASPDGGAWSGMQADITAPRGPTELTDDDATTIGALSNLNDEEPEEEVEQPYHLQISMDPQKDGPASIDIEMGRAKLSYPLRTPQAQATEEEVRTKVEATDQLEEDELLA